jgi:hypothetical protein
VRKLTKRQCTSACMFAVALLLSRPAIAQNGTSGSGNPTWGNYSWQVTQASATTVVFNATFNTPSGYVSIPLTIPSTPITVHEVHGNITLTVPGSGTNGSIIAQLIGSGNNVIASVKMQQSGPRIATVPISGKFYNALPASNLFVAFDVDEPGEQIVYISLTMD